MLCNKDILDKTVNEKVGLILKNGPEAVKAVKEMILKVKYDYSIHEVHNYTAELIAKLRLSKEGQEGMNAFLEKRKPSWVK